MITPLPFGGGEGGGASWGRGRGHHLSEPCVFCSSVFFCEKKYVILYLSLCHYVLKTTLVFFCHYIILSKNHTYLPLSLCHYVLKTTPVFFCHYIILSKNHTYLPLSLCHSVLNKYLSPFVIMSFCLKKTPVSPRPHVTLSSKPLYLLLPELVHLLSCLSHTLSCPYPLLLCL